MEEGEKQAGGLSYKITARQERHAKQRNATPRNREDGRTKANDRVKDGAGQMLHVSAAKSISSPPDVGQRDRELPPPNNLRRGVNEGINGGQRRLGGGSRTFKKRKRKKNQPRGHHSCQSSQSLTQVNALANI